LLIPMNTYDWIVVGGGLAGSAVSYELAKAGFSVLLLEQTTPPKNATRYSYGGISYWAGTTDLTRQLCQEGIALHRSLSAELDADTQFREVPLLLTIAPDRNPVEVAALYAQFDAAPTLLSAAEAQAIEPLLHRDNVAGALHFSHGHVSPEAVVSAYNQAFFRAGGTLKIAQVIGLIRQAERVMGVETSEGQYAAGNVVICAGGMSRALLRSANFPVRIYFTQAEMIEVPPTEVRLQAIVMPAELKRFALEAQAGREEIDALWDEPGHEILPAILDAGAVQFRDGTIRMGQCSRTCTDPQVCLDATPSEAVMRQSVGQVLPTLQQLPGEWHSCLVAFSGDGLPLIGAIPNVAGVHVFSGFSNPFSILPPLARRFADHAAGATDPLLAPLAPDRFTTPSLARP
jgi:glycine/D-amino acid oxidase-like deaminating enzyme